MPATKRTLDFTNVKESSGFRPKRLPAGDYLAEITDVADHKTDKDPNQWVFTIKPVDEPGAVYPYYCGSTETLLWKVRNLFLAAGYQVPKARKTVDPNKLIGKTIAITLEDDEYDGKMKSTIAACFPADELPQDADDDEPDVDEEDIEDDEDEEEEPPPPPARKTRAAAAPARKAAPAKATTRRAKPAPVEDEDDEDLEIDDL
jgi:hypothetical protein